MTLTIASRKVWLLGCLFVLVSLFARAWETPEEELEELSTLTLDYVTPHTAWARPYAQGGLRGYYFVRTPSEGMQTHAREAVELAQRLDLRLDVSYLYNFYKEHWFGGDAGERRIARLMARPHDVLIFQDLSPAKLPANPMQDGRTPFLDKVRRGAGVVLIGTDDGRLFTDAQAIAELPPFLAGTGAVKIMTVGEGRIIQMPPRPVIPYRVGWEIEYDYWQERLTRAVLWAAKREPKVQLQITCEAGLERGKLPAKTATVSWTGATPGQTTVALRLRRWDGQATALGEVKCDKAEGQTPFTVPVARGGAYHLDAFARTTAGSEAWANLPVEITAPARIATLELVSRQPLPARPEAGRKLRDWEEAAERRGIYTPYVEPGDEIKGTVAAAGELQGLQMRVSLVDRLGRELLRKVVPTEGAQTFAFKAESWMPMLLRVEAALVKGEEEVASDYRYQRITKRRQDQFNFVLWDAPGDETLGPYAMEKFADLGVTTILHHTPAPLLASAYEMSYVPWTGGNVHGRDAEEWPDPEHGKGFAEHMLRSRGSGVLSYSLGDEGAIAGMGGGPKTETAFRAYLQKAYGDIAALKRSWGGEYKSFDEITLKDARAPAPASPSGPENLARGYDLTNFAGYNFVEMAKKNRDWVRKLCDDPHAGIGFEGSGKIGKIGCDPELLCRELDLWVPYTGIGEEFIRSVAPRRFVRSAWMGYDRDAASFCGHYWRQIMNGADSNWYWMWSAIGGWMGFQSPNLAPPRPVQEMLDDTRIVREGLGDLLLQYEMQHDGIAVLYSYASIYANGDMGSGAGRARSTPRNTSFLSPWAAFGTWDYIIHDLNMQYNFVTDKMLVSGEFDAGRYKVLILPHALCLSPKAIATVRRFAENGGTVIADTRPAFYDDHCHPYERAALDDLFGIKGGFQPGVSTNAAIVGKLGLEDLKWAPDGTANDRKVIIDPTVVLTTGQALGKGGETPVCIVNTVGKGRAILLNLVVRSSVPVREYEGNLNAKPNLDPLPGDAARFFLGLMNEAGVERAFNFMEYKNEKVPFFTNVRVQRWKSGEYQIAGFFRQTDVQVRHGSFIPGGEKWPVSPQRKASGRPYPPLPWVYDLKNGLTVGPATWFITQIKPGRASIYALLPGPVPPMFVETPKQARRGAPLALKVSVPEARGLHAIKLRALLPDGRSAKFWDQSIMVSKKPKTVVLPLAWNDPAGTWMITFTDLFSTDTAQRVPLAVE